MLKVDAFFPIRKCKNSAADTVQGRDEGPPVVSLRGIGRHCTHGRHGPGLMFALSCWSILTHRQMLGKNRGSRALSLSLPCGDTSFHVLPGAGQQGGHQSSSGTPEFMGTRHLLCGLPWGRIYMCFKCHLLCRDRLRGNTRSGREGRTVQQAMFTEAKAHWPMASPPMASPPMASPVPMES